MSIEQIKFVTEKFLYNKESNELELEFSIRNISKERVTITGIEVENLGIFKGRVKKLVETKEFVEIIELDDLGCLIFSKVFQKHQLNRYSLLDDNLLLPFTTGYDSYDLDPDESALFMIKIVCVRTTEDLGEELKILAEYPLSQIVHVFSLIAYCRSSKVEDTDIRHRVQSDKIYSMATIDEIVHKVVAAGGFIKRRININIPEVINPDLRLTHKEIIEYHSETIEQFLRRMVTEYELKTENELFSFADLLKKLSKLNGRAIDEYLKDLSKTGDTEFQYKVSLILKAVSNEPVLKEIGRWRKFFHKEE